LKGEALACTLCRTRFGRGCGPVVRHSRQSKNSCATWHSLSFITLLTHSHTYGPSCAPIQTFHRARAAATAVRRGCIRGHIVPSLHSELPRDTALREPYIHVLRNIIASTDIIPAQVNCDTLYKVKKLISI
jgi:hypothetical protein